MQGADRLKEVRLKMKEHNVSGGGGSIIKQVNKRKKKQHKKTQNKTKTALLNIHIMHESSHCYDVKFTWVPTFAKGGVVFSGKVVT